MDRPSVCFSFLYDYTLNSRTFLLMFTLGGFSNLTCFNALSQKVVINYPLAGGREKKNTNEEKKKKKRS